MNYLPALVIYLIDGLFSLTIKRKVKTKNGGKRINLFRFFVVWSPLQFLIAFIGGYLGWNFGTTGELTLANLIFGNLFFLSWLILWRSIGYFCSKGKLKWFQIETT